MRVLFVLLAACLALTPSSVAGTCSKCQGKGMLVCPRHSKKTRGLEADALFCSEAAACPRCRGLLVVDCDLCDEGDAENALRRDEMDRFLEACRGHWDRFGHRFPIGRSQHFLLFWDGGPLSVRRKRVSPHASLHLYLDRLEGMMDEFCAATGASEDDFSTVFHVMVWKSARDNRTASRFYTNQPNPNVTGTKRMGAVGIYTVHIDPAFVDPDESATADLHRAIRHNVAHLLLANAWDGRWPGQLGGGWIDAGLAHWFEDRLDGRCTYFCYREQDTVASFRGGRWRAPVLKLAGRRDRPSFADVARKNTTELTLEEHALSWSYVDFLVATDADGFGALCRAIKQGKGYRDVLRERFGWSPFQFEERWREWVRENYASRRR